MDLFDGRRKRLLHFAPERGFSRILRRARNIDYFSGDLCSSRAMIRLNITDIPCPTQAFDVIFCSHVLEHIVDDRRAMAELFRVMKLGGWAILQVPIRGEKTSEDPTITTPEDRERVYGLAEHVRIYGKDYKDRLQEAGFDVTVDSFGLEFSEKSISRFGMGRIPDIYVCRKTTV
jgi:SAM-dependent methyltransferase